MNIISKYLFRTDHDTTSLILRVTLGLVMFPHGAQKVLGWFGGYGYAGTMGFFTETMGIPAPFAFLAILAEFAGSLALIAGFLTRLSAFGIGSVMIVAACMVHLEHGFFMNWSGAQAGEGFEYHILAAVIALVLVIKGGGRFAVDHLIQQKLDT